MPTADGRKIQGALERLLRALFEWQYGLLWAGLALISLIMLPRMLSRAQTDYTVNDFLINSAGGPVRRGLGGDAILWLVHHVGGAPVYWVWSLTVIAAAAMLGLSIRLFRKLPQTPAIVPLVLGPAGLFFFFYDPGAALRKDIFGMLAVVLVLQAAFCARLPARLGLSAGAVLIFILAFWLHEANFLLWPVFAAGLALAGRHWRGRGWAVWLALLGIGSLLAGILHFARVAGLPPPDIAAICRAAGVAPCGLPFTALGGTAGDAVAYMLTRHDLAVDIAFFALMLVLGLLPLALLRPAETVAPGPHPSRPWLVLILAAGLPLFISPLFVLASDWGRWLHMIVFPLTILGVAMVGLGDARIGRGFPTGLTLAYVLFWYLPFESMKIALPSVVLLAMLAVMIAARWLWRKSCAGMRAP